MKLLNFLLPAAMVLAFAGCSSDNGGLNKAEGKDNESGINAHKAVDYSKGRAMNARLGRGINMGNSWESTGTGAHPDCGWQNCIEDTDFQIVKAAGFNSIRLPIRWNIDAGPFAPYTIDDVRLAGVREDISIANSLGLAVIVDFHHYTDLNDAASNYETSPEIFNEELARFSAIWQQVAAALNDFPDDMVAFEILNEPHDIKKPETVNLIMTAGYNAIRAGSATKTVIFEANGYSKFANIKQLDLPEDGNIIVSGHYYEPYGFTHQGTADMYPCGATISSSDLTAIGRNFKQYADSAKAYYPDVDGVHGVPMNLGEFGGIGRNGSFCREEAPSEALRSQWANYVIKAAEEYSMSWHYWAYGKTSGFQAYDQSAGAWFPDMKAVFDAYTVLPLPPQ